MQPSKYVIINYELCRADHCASDEAGGCPAEEACSPGILTQEEPGEPPMMPSPSMCIGCGDCISSCAFDAITSSTA